MTRTTLKLDPDLLRRLKEKAAREGRTLQAVANDLLRRGLAEPKPADYALQLEKWSAQLGPGVDLFDRDGLFELMEDR